MADDKVEDRGSQQSPRNVHISLVKSKPHTARRWRHAITGNLREMGMNVVPRIYKRSALTIRGTLHFLLVEVVRFRVQGLFAYIVCGGRIGDNLFSLTARRTLAFHQRHGAAVDQSKRMKVFERENAVMKGKWGKCLCWKGKECLYLECEGNFS